MVESCSDGMYGGVEPYSEPEVRFYAKFVQREATAKCNETQRNHAPNSRLLVYLALHSYGQLWMLPWSHNVSRPADYSELVSEQLSLMFVLEKTF